MSIRRITDSFNLKDNGQNIFVYGNTSDRFILPNLRIVNLDELLFCYLKFKGFERVVFINPEAVGGIHTYDQRSLELLNLRPTGPAQNTENRAKNLKDIGFIEDDHWEQTSKNTKQVKPQSEVNPQIKSKRDARGRYFAEITGGNSVIEILDILIKSDNIKSAYIFTQFNQFFTHTHEQNASYMQKLSQLLQDWNSIDSPNTRKFFFIFINEYIDRDIHKYLDDRGIQSLMSVFIPGKTEIKTSNKIKLLNPKYDEIQTVLHRKRIISTGKFDWKNIDKIIHRIEQKEYTLNELQTRISSIKDLSYSELIREKIIIPLEIKIEEKKLDEALKEIRGQEDNLLMIKKQLIHWVKNGKKAAPLNFFMVGPSGVGKTFTAKKITKALEPWGFKNLYFDMTKFAESHTKSVLFGAPPSYVGYGETPQLRKAIQETPRLVIVFDEIEKAHKDILISLMQLLDAGIVQFADGTQKNFKECIIFFTSNLEREKVMEIKKQYLEQSSANKISDQLFQNQIRTIIEQSKDCPTEVTGRIQNLLVYNAIKGKDLIEIALQNLLSIAKEEGINLIEIEPEVLAEITLKCENSTKGMRELERELQDIFVYRDI